ncbi:hypothetical protein ACHAW6_009276 [Cyclotella cf. meneghiniana]
MKRPPRPSSPPSPNLSKILRLLTTAYHGLPCYTAAFRHVTAHKTSRRPPSSHEHRPRLLHPPHRHHPHATHLFLDPSHVIEPQQQTADDWLPPSHALSALLPAAARACRPRRLDTTQDAHEAFRYEWGTWCDADALEEVMAALGEIRWRVGAYDGIVNGTLDTVWVGGEEGREMEEKDGRGGGRQRGRRIRMAGGKYWDVILHVLPKNARHMWKWTEGSWTVLQPLTGLVEIAKLRGPDARGFYSTVSPRNIRGGSDADDAFSAQSSSSNDGYSTAGEASVKYLGGPLRSYTGKAMLSTLLEVVIRPPITTSEKDAEATGRLEELRWEHVENVLARVKPCENGTIVEDDMSEAQTSDVSNNKRVDGGNDKDTSLSTSTGLNKKLGMDFENVGGLDTQLDDIARRVLASRANPHAAKRLGISHVRGILLSGPPGCGKTLLARELSRLLGSREPQIVNGPEILDKFIGEAERRVRELFLPAEREYDEVGDASALHLIILDEIDAIARKRGSMTSDTTGVRDSVVNQLLAKMDGVKEAPNILVVGLTNRPELIDPALLRPGRLEVQLRVELPDRAGRRDILRIHTRKMKDGDALSQDAIDLIENLDDNGMGARTEHFSGAELAGLVRSAASFALARAIESDGNGVVTSADLERALEEVRPALGTQDDVLRVRYPFGISEFSSSVMRIKRDLNRFTAPVLSSSPQLHSLLLVGGGAGAGSTALAAWAAAEASVSGRADYVRFITALDILTAESGGGDKARASALVERFSEAREISSSLMVLDDICAGDSKEGYSTIMVSTLRALLRTPPPDVTVAKAGGQGKTMTGRKKTMHVIAVTSRPDAACFVLNELFEETIVVPLLTDVRSVQTLINDSIDPVVDVDAMSTMILDQLKEVGCKTILRLVERAIFTAGMQEDLTSSEALHAILQDYAGDEATVSRVCTL